MTKYLVFVSLLFLSTLTHSQSYTVSGYVIDQTTKERMVGAYVVDTISHTGTSSNEFGFYSLNIGKPQVAIVASYVGANSSVSLLTLAKDTLLSIFIESNHNLSEVVVELSTNTKGLNRSIGLSAISAHQMKSIPTLGETDVIKALQLEPGVKGGVEGSAGIYVRGGGMGENLFLLDDVPVYNVSHLYGFFSAFNSSSIKDMKLYKSSFPAQYGGRTSAVVAIRTREGTADKLAGEVSLGLVSSKFLLEGPLFNEKTTFIFSARRSYIDFVSKSLKRVDLVDQNFPNYMFYDLNFGLTHTFSSKDRLFINAYYGKDKNDKLEEQSQVFEEGFSETSRKEEQSGWGNLIASLRWNHVFGGKLFLNTTIATSQYNYSMENSSYLNTKKVDAFDFTRDYSATYQSEIEDYIAKLDFDYFLNDQVHFKFGGGNTFHKFQPGNKSLSVIDENIGLTSDTSFSNGVVSTNEYFMYVQGFFQLTNRLSINGGLRVSGQAYDHTNDMAYEPRLALNYKLSENWMLKAGASQMVQYAHLIRSVGTSMPIEIWVPATGSIKPLRSQEFSLGTSYQYFQWFLNLEFYSKRLNNTARFSPGTSLFTDLTSWDESIIQGDGEASGFEFSVEKQQGKVRGMFSYVYALANRSYAEINEGASFPFEYDRLHDLTVGLSYQFAKKWDVSALWVFGSGFPITLPESSYLPHVSLYNITAQFGGRAFYYPSYNASRLPAYHRLDLGVHYNTKNKLGTHSLSFDIYNAYNRANPINAYYSIGVKPVLKYTTLLPIIPSISYTLKF